MIQNFKLPQRRILLGLVGCPLRNTVGILNRPMDGAVYVRERILKGCGINPADLDEFYKDFLGCSENLFIDGAHVFHLIALKIE